MQGAGFRNYLGIESSTPRQSLPPISSLTSCTLNPVVNVPQFLPPDHSKGDELTIGGYAAVHARPAAFEGMDGVSYSVEIETDETGDPDAPFGGFLLFVRWTPGEPRISGHLESDFLTHGATEAEARERIGAFSLERVREILDDLIRAHAPPSGRPWWEAMRSEGEGEGEAQQGEGDGR